MTYICLGYLIGTYLGVYLEIQPLFLILILILIIVIKILNDYINKINIFQELKKNKENNENNEGKKYKKINFFQKSKIKVNIFLKTYYFKLLLIIIIVIIAILRINSIENNREEIYKLSNLDNNIENSFNIKIIDKNEYENSNTYIVKVIEFNKYNKKNKIKRLKVILKTKEDLKISKIYNVKGRLFKFQEEKNYKGFNERKYYYSKGIDFILEVEKDKDIILIKDYSLNHKDILDYIILLKQKIYNKIDKYIKKSDIFKAIILGDTKELDSELKEDFKQVNIYHILSMSGMHVSYLVLLLQFLFNKLKLYIDFKIKKIIQIFILLFFMILVGMSSSILRAVFLVIITLIFQEFNIKYGFLNSIFLSFVIILIINPYIVYSSGLYLSYISVISIYFFLKIEENLKLISKLINVLKIDKNKEWQSRDKIFKRQKYKYEQNKVNNLNNKFNYSLIVKNILKKIVIYIFTSIYISIVVYISLLPLLIYYFNEITINFFLATLLTSIVFSLIMFLGFIFIFINIFIYCLNMVINLSININNIFNFIIKGISNLININISLFLKLIDFVVSISKNYKTVFYLRKPHIISIFLYYIFLFFFFYIFSNNIISKFSTPKMYLKNNLNKLKYIFLNRKILNILVLIVFIFSNFSWTFNLFNNFFNCFFIYVGQGDSSFVVTSKNTTILIDTGSGGPYSFNDYGKEIRRYILARGYRKIDHVFISHFDIDHVGGAYTLIDTVNIRKIYIPKYVGKYLEKEMIYRYGDINSGIIEKIKENLNDSEYMNKNILELDFIHYYLLKERANQKKINIIELERGDFLQLDKNTYIEVLFPTKDLVSNNFSNNNSLVFKLTSSYKKDINNRNKKININKKNSNISILYTGDIEKDGINKLIELNKKRIGNEFKLNTNILKIPHHGSKNSLNPDFIKLVNPDIAIISCGIDNLYKHPHKEVLETLNDLNIKSYRTDVSGEIYFNEKDKKIEDLY